MVGREVVYVKCHGAIFIPGIPQGDVIDMTKEKHKGVKMSLTEVGLLVTSMGVETLIPLSNVSQLRFGAAKPVVAPKGK